MHDGSKEYIHEFIAPTLYWTSQSCWIIAIHSACIRNPTVGFKPLARPSTPCSPHGSTSTGSTPLAHPHVASPTFGQLPANLQLPPTASAGSQSQKAPPGDNHSPSFAVPFAPVKGNVSHFQTEHRWAYLIFVLFFFGNFEIIGYLILSVGKGVKNEHQKILDIIYNSISHASVSVDTRH